MLEFAMYAVAWILVGFVSVIVYIGFSNEGFRDNKYVCSPIKKKEAVNVAIMGLWAGPIMVMTIIGLFLITMIKRLGWDKYPKKTFNLFKKKIESLYD